jgi:hypothetical protein
MFMHIMEYVLDHNITLAGLEDFINSANDILAEESDIPEIIKAERNWTVLVKDDLGVFYPLPIISANTKVTEKKGRRVVSLEVGVLDHFYFSDNLNRGSFETPGNFVMKVIGLLTQVPSS